MKKEDSIQVIESTKVTMKNIGTQVKSSAPKANKNKMEIRKTVIIDEDLEQRILAYGQKRKMGFSTTVRVILAEFLDKRA